MNMYQQPKAGARQDIPQMTIILGRRQYYSFLDPDPNTRDG